MWICTGGYRQFREEWVKEVYRGDMSGKCECGYWGSFIHFLATKDSCPKQDMSLKGPVAHLYPNFPSA